MKIKILFFLPSLNAGGAERVVMNIIRKLDKEKFEISLVLVDKTGEYLDLIPSGVGVYDLGVKKTIFSILKLHNSIRKIKPDIVFSTLFRTHIALDIALTGLSERPFVILRSPNSPKLVSVNKQLKLVQKILLERAYRKADVIVAQTPEMKDEIVKYHGTDEKKIRVLLNPLDTDVINEKIKNIKNPFDTNYINVVAAGKLTKQKGFDILIRSFKNVVEKNPDFVLHLIGKDYGEKENLEAIIEELHLEKHINFLGFQENPYKYFYFSDLYVLSSRWEGLPNTVLENLYLKKPVVATKCIPFMNKLIKNGENGFLVDVDNSEELANAIINYKKIKLKFEKFEENKNEINELFHLRRKGMS